MRKSKRTAAHLNRTKETRATTERLVTRRRYTCLQRNHRRDFNRNCTAIRSTPDLFETDRPKHFHRVTLEASAPSRMGDPLSPHRMNATDHLTELPTDSRREVRSSRRPTSPTIAPRNVVLDTKYAAPQSTRQFHSAFIHHIPHRRRQPSSRSRPSVTLDTTQK